MPAHGMTKSASVSDGNQLVKVELVLKECFPLADLGQALELFYLTRQVLSASEKIE